MSKSQKAKKPKQAKSNFSIKAKGAPSKTAFPKEQLVTFNYSQVCTFSGAGGSPSSWVFRLNSLYDFDYTSTGHQPFQYDQMMAIYNRYRVYTTSVDITFVNQYTTTTSPAFIACYPSNVNSPVSSVLLASEQPFSYSTLLAPSAAGGCLQHVYKTFNIANILGYSENVDDDLSAANSTNPSQVAFFTIMVDHPNASNGFSVTCLIKVKFYARVYDLVSPGQSLSQKRGNGEEEDDKYIVMKVKK